MKHIETYQLFEKKQVGVIYHFTDTRALWRILEEDRMRSGSYDKNISFTRNPDLKSWYEDFDAICRVSFNGSDLSDKYRIEPHLYNPQRFIPLQDEDILDPKEMPYQKRKEMYGEEREERIKSPEIKGIKKYIIQVDVMEDHIKTYDDRANLREAEKHGVKINYVKQFSNVKSDSI